MHNIEEFLKGKTDCEQILRFYKDDFDGERLTLHRAMCTDIAKQRGISFITFQDIVDFLKGDQGDPLRTM